MALHIRQERTEKLARDVAKRTGETLTEAVYRALAERLARLSTQKREDEERMLRDLRDISRRSAAAFRATGETRTSTELLDELYDENGLPR